MKVVTKEDVINAMEKLIETIKSAQDVSNFEYHIFNEHWQVPEGSTYTYCKHEQTGWRDITIKLRFYTQKD